MNHKKPTRIIAVFSGLDGSGKSTQANMLLAELNKNGNTAIYLWNRWVPFLLGGLIRLSKKILFKKQALESYNSNFEGAGKRYEEWKLKKRSLSKSRIIRNLWLWYVFWDYFIQTTWKFGSRSLWGKNIILDRYYYDLIIDQAINLDLSKEEITLWAKRYNKKFPKPANVFFFDLPVDIAINRQNDIGYVEYFNDRRDLYLFLGELFNINKIDASETPDKVYDSIKAKIILEN